MRCPRARVIDITHAIPPQDVRTGALVLRDALVHMPPGVHLAVVDPGVGASGAAARRAVAIRTAEQARLLVGPDNGLLALAAARFGGAAESADIGASPERLQPVSATFHGRDIFAPVAAALADGAALADVGSPLPVSSLRELPLPRAQLREAALLAHVLRIDRFGNLALDASGAELTRAGIAGGAQIAVGVGGREHVAAAVTAFADAPEGELLIYVDSTGGAALAVNGGSAAARLEASPGDELVLRAAPGANG